MAAFLPQTSTLFTFHYITYTCECTCRRNERALEWRRALPPGVALPPGDRATQAPEPKCRGGVWLRCFGTAASKAAPRPLEALVVIILGVA